MFDGLKYSKKNEFFLDPIYYIHIATGFKILNDAGIFDNLFDQNVVKCPSINNYIETICGKIVSLRDVKYPHWIELLNNLLAFVLSRNSNDINEWLLRDLIVSFFILCCHTFEKYIFF